VRRPDRRDVHGLVGHRGPALGTQTRRTERRGAHGDERGPERTKDLRDHRLDDVLALEPHELPQASAALVALYGVPGCRLAREWPRSGGTGATLYSTPLQRPTGRRVPTPAAPILHEPRTERNGAVASSFSKRCVQRHAVTRLPDCSIGEMSEYRPLSFSPRRHGPCKRWEDPGPCRRLTSRAARTASVGRLPASQGRLGPLPPVGSRPRKSATCGSREFGSEPGDLRDTRANILTRGRRRALRPGEERDRRTWP
jgi:hypothetical protein